jgi:hypothetical protein
MKQLTDARQRETQSPSDFDIYLDSLEKHFPRQDEKTRAYAYYAKLTADLRAHFDLHCPTIPETRGEIVAIATRYWESKERIRKRKAESEPYRASAPKRYKSLPPRPFKTPQPPSQSISPPTNRLNPQGQDGRRLRCFNCKSDTHLRNECPTAAVQEVRTSRTTSEYPAKRQGNWRAPRGNPSLR